MSGRFAKPGFPGDTLTTRIWVDRETALFDTHNQRGEALLERGEFSFAKT